MEYERLVMTFQLHDREVKKHEIVKSGNREILK